MTKGLYKNSKTIVSMQILVTAKYQQLIERHKRLVYDTSLFTAGETLFIRYKIRGQPNTFTIKVVDLTA